MSGTCSDCPYYEATDGTCRRYPPSTFIDPNDGTPLHLRPEVSSTGYCAEHPVRQVDQIAAGVFSAVIAAAEFPTQYEACARRAIAFADAMRAARLTSS